MLRILSLAVARGESVAEVAFDQVSKVYPDGTRAASQLDLDIEDGELIESQRSSAISWLRSFPPIVPLALRGHLFEDGGDDDGIGA